MHTFICQHKNTGSKPKNFSTVFISQHKNTVSKPKYSLKCNWSPFEGQKFNSQVTHTFVNGNLAYNKGDFSNELHGEKILFER